MKRVFFCEGQYGGLFRGGALPRGMYLPEYGSSVSALFILWCGLHMLLFNRHDSTLLKAIAGLFVANGASSFAYHWTGYASVHEVDGNTMLTAVWLSTGFVLDELLSNLVERRQPDGQQPPSCGWSWARRLARAVYWPLVVGVPYMFWLLGQEPLSELVGGDNGKLFEFAFVLPLIFMFGAILAMQCKGCGVGTAFVGPDGLRTRKRARCHFIVGGVTALVGGATWAVTESSCDQLDFFKVFPGHMVFHLTMALGLMNCLLYPSMLRADNFGATPHLVSELIRDGSLRWARPGPLTTLATAYFTVMPAFVLEPNAERGPLVYTAGEQAAKGATSRPAPGDEPGLEPLGDYAA